MLAEEELDSGETLSVGFLHRLVEPAELEAARETSPRGGQEWLRSRCGR